MSPAECFSMVVCEHHFLAVPLSRAGSGTMITSGSMTRSRQCQRKDGNPCTSACCIQYAETSHGHLTGFARHKRSRISTYVTSACRISAHALMISFMCCMTSFCDKLLCHTIVEVKTSDGQLRQSIPFFAEIDGGGENKLTELRTALCNGDEDVAERGGR
jgi:hypothetical protein